MSEEDEAQAQVAVEEPEPEEPTPEEPTPEEPVVEEPKVEEPKAEEFADLDNLNFGPDNIEVFPA